MNQPQDDCYAPRHIIKWTDGENCWCLDIEPGNIGIKTTAPIGLPDQSGASERVTRWLARWENDKTNGTV